MKIRITRTVPGYTAYRVLLRGDVVELDKGLAFSLIQDGYAEAVAEAPAERRETRGPGRPRKEA